MLYTLNNDGKQRNKTLRTCVLLYRWSSFVWMLLMVSFMCG